ncbi:hypothetical protein [Natranaerobius trueperi]
MKADQENKTLYEVLQEKGLLTEEVKEAINPQNLV